MASKPSQIPPRVKMAIFALLAVFLAAIVYIASKADWSVDVAHSVADAQTIYSGLPPNAIEANATFRERVSNSFPLQTAERDLVQKLSDQGFRSDGWFGSKRMTYRRLAGGRGRCDIAASVTWEADDQGRISTLDARFLRTPGCVDTIQ